MEWVPTALNTRSLTVAVLEDLGRRRFTNVLVEGGAGVFGTFLDADAIDEVHAYVGPILIGGEAAPSPVGGGGVGRLQEAKRFARTAVEVVGGDVWVRASRSTHLPLPEPHRTQ